MRDKKAKTLSGKRYSERGEEERTKEQERADVPSSRRISLKSEFLSFVLAVLFLPFHVPLSLGQF